ncbi:hypothetical protein M0638_12640 [Roseomonas sp. NAR14]|uniref:Uncharacterized protein n=1 Tax=Roseomonas acroporae TaxID=2937791 RepID=A0A9X2BU16_9PROT|nr:hypothetical protein [Roseomonas acroporae]MCK8785233.1 hypothetical protein [Roseomonas acroporae]
MDGSEVNGSGEAARGGCPAPVFCGVSDDRRHTRVQADAVLGPAELETLIVTLLACRAAMAPRRLPLLFEGSRTLVGDAWKVRDDGAVMVHHPGLGWIGAVGPSRC